MLRPFGKPKGARSSRKLIDIVNVFAQSSYLWWKRLTRLCPSKVQEVKEEPCIIAFGLAEWLWRYEQKLWFLSLL